MAKKTDSPVKKRRHKLKKPMAVPHIDGDFYVLGCDLSMFRPGFAILSYEESTRKVKLVRVGVVDNKRFPNKYHGKILNEIAKGFTDFANDLRIKVAVRERALSRFNAETQTLNKVTGITDMILWKLNEGKFVEYAPSSVKKSVTGWGRATKEEVAEAVASYISNISDFEFDGDDESDACAVGLAFLIENKYIDRIILPQYIDKCKDEE